MNCAATALLVQNAPFRIMTIHRDRMSARRKARALTRTYEAQLDHIGFDWIKDANYFVQKLALVEDEILKRVGFTGNDGCLCIAAAEGVSFITAQTKLMNDIAGALALAAAVQMDGNFKATNKIIATLRAVAKNPGLVETHRIEPEALGAIAASYQRIAEPPGTFWFDVYQDDNAHPLDLAGIKRAAERAINELRADIKLGRPPSLVLSILATRLSEVFLRYNDVATRHSIAISENDQTRLVLFSNF